ncbi:hypothetical protein VTJ83DRAFT_4799 [Remersonia thermophila]|uniref:Uncharacterized protein n=1 Tax=Remersonia thermophila TaxID=72144 RepID=A0ABR4DB72_9PEZI
MDLDQSSPRTRRQVRSMYHRRHPLCIGPALDSPAATEGRPRSEAPSPPARGLATAGRTGRPPFPRAFQSPKITVFALESGEVRGHERLAPEDLLESGEGGGGEDGDDFLGARVDEAYAFEGGDTEVRVRRAGDAKGIDPDLAAVWALEDDGREGGKGAVRDGVGWVENAADPSQAP